ncbi:hypothetical protein NDS46_24560 [Paenibacillus thiaminolyticus]|uniref:hypothetical protein n=1 Tax=Paenibacillus thiaminolyticus TaxID=49283 RepID=UPI00232E89C4|nr:hypothetical protein [Paenibacillus thiaminolyticus]WCF07453.1 hypothetical protein NDS46_24560 [Paenibacillus thiaminolyticus]
MTVNLRMLRAGKCAEAKELIGTRMAGTEGHGIQLYQPLGEAAVWRGLQLFCAKQRGGSRRRALRIWGGEFLDMQRGEQRIIAFLWVSPCA